jgi:hypothetical protein
MGWVANPATWPLYPHEINSVPTVQEAGRTATENLPHHGVWTRTVQPVVSRSTGCVMLAAMNCNLNGYRFHAPVVAMSVCRQCGNYVSRCVQMKLWKANGQRVWLQINTWFQGGYWLLPPCSLPACSIMRPLKAKWVWSLCNLAKHLTNEYAGSESPSAVIYISHKIRKAEMLYFPNITHIDRFLIKASKRGI